MSYLQLDPTRHAQVIRTDEVRVQLRRLARLKASSYELGLCEHGPVAKCRAQVGRAEKTFSASFCEAPTVAGVRTFADAVEALGDAIEADRRGRLPKIGAPAE